MRTRIWYFKRRLSLVAWEKMMFEKINIMISKSPDLLSLLHLLLAIKYWFYLGLTAVCVYLVFSDRFRRKTERRIVRKKSFEFVA